MRHRLKKKDLKILFKNRKIDKLRNYFIEFKVTENGKEYFNLYEETSLLGKFIVILLIPFLIIYSIILQGVPETFRDLKKVKKYIINHKRVDYLNTNHIEELKKVVEK